MNVVSRLGSGLLVPYSLFILDEKSHKWSRNFPSLMDAEVSLLCLQQSATDLFREPGVSSSHDFLLSLRSILILASHFRLGLPNDFLLSVFHLSSVPFVHDA